MNNPYIEDWIKYLNGNTPDFSGILEYMEGELKELDSLRDIRMSMKQSEDILTRLSTARLEYEILKENIEEEAIYDNEMYRNLACITDFMNSLAHIYQIRYEAGGRRNILERKKSRAYMGLKDTGITTLAKFSQNDVAGGIYMGLKRDDNDKMTVICDIPGVGQVGWHVPDGSQSSIQNPYSQTQNKEGKTELAGRLRENYGIKDYRYQYERKGDVQYNIDVLALEGFEKFGMHNQIVARSGSKSEMEALLDDYYGNISGNTDDKEKSSPSSQSEQDSR